MKYFFLFLIFALSLSRVQAQDKDHTQTSEPIYEAVDESPEPPGGMHKFNEYLSKHIRYPKAAKKANAQGKVYVSLIIDKQGRITNVTVKKDNVGYGCGEEAVRVIKNMPRWTPGRMNGKPVSVKYVIPVTFILRE